MGSRRARPGRSGARGALCVVRVRVVCVKLGGWGWIDFPVALSCVLREWEKREQLWYTQYRELHSRASLYIVRCTMYDVLMDIPVVRCTTCTPLPAVEV